MLEDITYIQTTKKGSEASFTHTSPPHKPIMSAHHRVITYLQLQITAQFPYESHSSFLKKAIGMIHSLPRLVVFWFLVLEGI